jgi:hypothetical protein
MKNKHLNRTMLRAEAKAVPNHADAPPLPLALSSDPRALVNDLRGESKVPLS